MSQQWYLSRQGQQYGPYSWEQLREFAGSGQVMSEELIWGSGMTDWVKAAEVEGLFNTAQPFAQTVPPPPPVQAQGLPEPSVMAPDQPAGAQSGEKMVGIIPGMRRKTGLLSSKLYNLVITERRMIFAEMTSGMLNQAAKDAAEEAKAQGKGFFARAAETMKSAQRIYQKYWQMAPENILAETAGNYSLELCEITSIKMRHGMYHDDTGQYDKDEMHIKTGREKIKLFFEYGSTTGEAKKLLRELLGKVVR